MQENCTRVSQPSSKITITNVIFLYFFTPRKVSVVEILRGAHMLRPWYKSEKVQVVPCLCFIRKIFSLNFKTVHKPSLFKALQKLCFLELYTNLGFLEDYDLGRHPLCFLRCLCLCFWPPSCQNVTFYSFCRPFLFTCRDWAKRGTSHLGTKKPAKPPMFWHLVHHLEYYQAVLGIAYAIKW